MRVLTCTVETTPCPSGSELWVDAPFADLLLNGGFDLGLFEAVLSGLFGLFIVSVGVGMIIAQIRKGRL